MFLYGKYMADNLDFGMILDFLQCRIFLESVDSTISADDEDAISIYLLIFNCSNGPTQFRRNS